VIKEILPVKILLLLLLLPGMSMKGQNVDIIISGIRSEKGQIVIGVFKDSESYRTEEVFMRKAFLKDVDRNGVMKVQLNLEPGVYGLCLLDDEDSDGIMHYNFLGMPKEGFGFSNLNFTGFTKPKFDSFKFRLNQEEKKLIKFNVRYIL
jgi:uncharacterized protein (DUF2141 family)